VGTKLKYTYVFCLILKVNKSDTNDRESISFVMILRGREEGVRLQMHHIEYTIEIYTHDE